MLKRLHGFRNFFSRNLEKYLKDMTKNLFLIAVSLSKEIVATLIYRKHFMPYRNTYNKRK